MSYPAHAVPKLPKFSLQPQALPDLHPPCPLHFLLTPRIALPEPHQPPHQAWSCLRALAWAVLSAWYTFQGHPTPTALPSPPPVLCPSISLMQGREACLASCGKF